MDEPDRRCASDPRWVGLFGLHEPALGALESDPPPAEAGDALLLIGTVAYLALEWGNPKTLGALEPRQRFHAAFFMSVTPRTAGFNTVGHSLVTHASTFVTLLLMCIGASPGSTGGGIKTTTFFVLLLSTISFVRYSGEPNIFGRRITLAVILKALAVTFLGVQLVGLAFTALSLTDPKIEPVRLPVEAVSALATVGLTMNLTPVLSDRDGADVPRAGWRPDLRASPDWAQRSAQTTLPQC